jgi:hypothetical protein
VKFLSFILFSASRLSINSCESENLQSMDMPVGCWQMVTAHGFCHEHLVKKSLKINE